MELTTQTKPEAATHWRTRKKAAVVDVSPSSVMRHWQANGLKPHLVRRFKAPRDPKFVEKLEDIVGLYLSPPEHALGNSPTSTHRVERYSVELSRSLTSSTLEARGSNEPPIHSFRFRCSGCLGSANAASNSS